jgi:hypothetical protein
MSVIGIYGVRGEEDRFIDIFSPKWFRDVQVPAHRQLGSRAAELDPDDARGVPPAAGL